MAFSLFPALFEHPAKVQFAQQEADETVELLLRQHWVTQVFWVVTVLLAFFLPVVLPYLSPLLALSQLPPIPLDVAAALLVIWYMLVIAYGLEKFLHWYFNIYIVTDKHLVDINLHNLMNRDVVEVQVEDVQSSSYKMLGVLSSLFNFGDVVIETAAQRQNIQFHQVPRPAFVADKISDLRAKRDLERQGGGDAV